MNNRQRDRQSNDRENSRRNWNAMTPSRPDRFREHAQQGESLRYGEQGDWYSRNERRRSAQRKHRSTQDFRNENATRYNRGGEGDGNWRPSDYTSRDYREDYGQPGYGERYGFSGYGRAYYDPDINRGWSEEADVETWREGAPFSDREQDYRGGRWDRERHTYSSAGRSRSDSSPRIGESRSGLYYRPSSETREYADYGGGETEQDTQSRSGFTNRSYSNGDGRGWNDYDMRFGRGGFAGIAPKNYQRSDARIQEDVCDRLTAHPYIDPSNIEVKVVQGEVILTGEVPDRQMKRLAEDIADEAAGVANVNNQLRVERMEPKSANLNGSFEQPMVRSNGHRQTVQ